MTPHTPQTCSVPGRRRGGSGSIHPVAPAGGVRRVCPGALRRLDGNTLQGAQLKPSGPGRGRPAAEGDRRGARLDPAADVRSQASEYARAHGSRSRLHRDPPDRRPRRPRGVLPPGRASRPLPVTILDAPPARGAQRNIAHSRPTTLFAVRRGRARQLNPRGPRVRPARRPSLTGGGGRSGAVSVKRLEPRPVRAEHLDVRQVPSRLEPEILGSTPSRATPGAGGLARILR